MRKIMYVAVAAIAALSSCSSDEFAGNNGINGDFKVFTGTIENDGVSSRSTLVSKTANWESTDKVCINGAIYTVSPVSGDATKATFTKESGTEPTGTYKAFYADGANSGNYWDSSTSTFKLPASYTYSETGKFNMPMYAESTTTSLGFKNICGVLAITVPENTTSVAVKSENQMNGAFTATADGVLTFTSTTITTAQQTVTVNYPTSGSNQTVYVPVPAGNYDALVIECNSQSMTVKKTVTVERNKIYPISFSSNSVTTRGLAEATVSAGSSDKKYVAWVQLWSGGPKFATVNVGASSSTEAGLYFAWGETEGHSGEISSDKTCKDGYSYKWANAPFNHQQSSYYETYFSNYGRKDATGSDTGETLVSTYDAVTAKWGSTWKMPTKENFDGLVNTSNCTWSWDSTNKGYTFTGATTGYTSNSIFLPAAGYRSSTNLTNAGSDGYYWSSTLYSGSLSEAYNLHCYSSSVSCSSTPRLYGRSVRAVCSE